MGLASFQQFLKANGIRHARSAPYHPATNGLAERAVQSVKEGLRKAKEGSLQTKLSRFLYQYRLSPHTTTGVSPSELLIGRRMRSHLDLVLPSTKSCVITQQFRQKQHHDYHAHSRTFTLDDHVFVKNFTSSCPKWFPGKIIAVRGLVSYDQLMDGTVVHRHLDHIRPGIHLPSGGQENEDDSDMVPPIELAAEEQPEDIVRWLSINF